MNHSSLSSGNLFEDDDFEDMFFANEGVRETEEYTDSENDVPYCLCEQDNDKEMIFCDGSNCEYER